jgi:transcriptional antiterminator RfaH
MSTAYWVVAKTKGSLESFAAEHVKRQGHQYYLPMTRETSAGNQRGKLVRNVPLFPRYLFIEVESTWRHLMSTRGITGVLLAGEAPARLPTQYVTDLKLREKDGLVVLPSMDEARRFARGQTVHVSSGLFAGEIGIYDGCSGQERERVLLEILGRKVSVLIAPESLEAVA